jgi:uncharacterized membrane protein
MNWTLVLLAFHLASALTALVQGFRAWWTPRGTRVHRRLGAWYLVAVLPLSGTACGLYALSGRASATLLGLATTCLLAGLATPALALARRPGLRAWHGHAACLSLACLAGAIVEVLRPGPWTWPVVAIVAAGLRAFPRPVPAPVSR